MLAVGDLQMQLVVAEAVERSLADKLGLEKRTGQLLDQAFASLQFVELAQVFAAGSAGPGIGHTVRFFAQSQESPG